MSDKTKFYIFDKKELTLIFIFMLITAIVAFILGVKFGKNYSFEQAGLEEQDQERIELLSEQEEQVRKIMQEGSSIDAQERLEPRTLEEEEGPNKKGQSEVHKEANKKDPIYERLSDEFGKLDKAEDNIQNPLQSVSVGPSASGPLSDGQEKVGEEALKAPEDQVVFKSQNDGYFNKYTIQLGSYRSIDEAKSYAQGFKARGYDPIIWQADLKERGVWFRVSLGVFENVTEAKEFIIKNDSLFQGHEPVIQKFD